MGNLRLVSFFERPAKAIFPKYHRRKETLLGLYGRKICNVREKPDLQIWGGERRTPFHSSRNYFSEEKLSWKTELAG